jgi:hypothetical protein
MRKTSIVVLILLVLALHPIWATDGTLLFSKGSMILTGQVGLNTMVRTADPFAEPFSTLPLPFGASFEFMLTDHIGLGGTMMYDQWSDYLGMFGGKWTFRLLRPSFECAYHLSPRKVRCLDFYAGMQFGYTFVAVSNNLGNRYDGNLRSETHLAPVVGAHLNPWPSSRGFPGRISVTLKVAYSMMGRFSDVYCMAGLTYRLK